MPRNIKHLPDDLRKQLMQGVAESAVEIVEDLSTTGPWWTGSFSSNWNIGSSPIRATKERQPGALTDKDKFPSSRFSVRLTASKLPLNTPTYIGNEVKYAGFVVNNPGASAPDRTASSYEDHLAKVGVNKSTVPDKISNKPRWYDVYLTHTAFLAADIDKGFNKADFTVIKGANDQFTL
tara:strand:+ start:337 stop:873 length:537 start_codon:yes stop_codon:yes gene_type:complete